MALKSTILKVQISIANISANHYEDYNLTLAKHPSESDERVVCRIVAFALHAHQDLIFGKGISTNDEPDIWLKHPNGQIEEWIDLGQPDEKRIRKACGKSSKVYIYNYQTGAAKLWWQGLSFKTRTNSNLQVRQFILAGEEPLSSLLARSMKLNCTIEDGDVFLTSEDDSQGSSVNLKVQAHQEGSEKS